MAEPRTMHSDALDKLGQDVGTRSFAASVAAIGAALLASLCCIGPVLFVTLGVGAGIASQFEPLRPVFTILTLGLLALGFYAVYGPRRTIATRASYGVDGSCTVPRSRTRDKIMLWVATLFALILLTFPQWSMLVI